MGMSQNEVVLKNWGPCCLRQFSKCSNRKSTVLDQDPSLFFQAIDKAGAFGVSTLFGLLAPHGGEQNVTLEMLIKGTVLYINYELYNCTSILI